MKSVLAMICAILTNGYYAYAQDHAVAEHVFIDLPTDTRSEDVFIRYKISADRQAEINFARRESRVHEYSIPVASSIGGKPESVNVVVYSPGCQFQRYVLDVRGPTDIHQQFQCVPLPTKHLHATIPAAEIPRNPFRKDGRLDVRAELSDDWTCDYFLRLRPDDPSMTAGSCLGSSVPLGSVGWLDPSKGGSFELDLPDFALDPTFKEFGNGSYGSVVLALHDKATGRVLAILQRRDGSERDHFVLNVSGTYVEPIAFTAKGSHVGVNRSPR